VLRFKGKIQAILDQRLRDLKAKGVQNGAVLVLDHQNSEVLAWVNGGASLEKEISESWIDAVTTPRQPGSTLKPFLYALALEKGWTAATRVKDLPLAAPVGHGLHTYHNYSRTHYGPLPLRHALGNSLNTPAVRTIQFVGVGPLPELPQIHGHPQPYINTRITTVKAWHWGTVKSPCWNWSPPTRCLANRGIYRPLKTVHG
jgi:membrane carboxypeptidase/penicillin-binding protein PbpC